MLRFLLQVLLCTPLPGADSALISRGFNHFYNLEYDEALRDFTQAAEAAPDDPGPCNYAATTVLYREMYRSGALESELVSGNNPFVQRARIKTSPADQELFFSHLAKAMSLSEARISRNPNDARAHYTLGIAYALRSNYNFLVRKAWMDSLRDATQARRLHNRAWELDNTLVDARLVQGLHDYVVGSLPWTYRFLGFLVGFRGDREGGIRLVQLVAEHGASNKTDAQVLLAVIYRRERRPQDAIPLLEKLVESYPRNHLFRLEMVQMFGDLGRKEEALAVLKTLEEMKRKGGYRTMPLEKVFFARGTLLFWYRDYDLALRNLQPVTAKASELDVNTGTFAWLRTGQIRDLQGRRSEALDCYRAAIALAPDSDAAQESRRYLSSPYRRKG